MAGIEHSTFHRQTFVGCRPLAKISGCHGVPHTTQQPPLHRALGQGSLLMWARGGGRRTSTQIPVAP